MHREGEEVHISTDEARGGSTPGVMRYVLAISLFLAIGAMSLVWIAGALHSGDGRSSGDISGQAQPRS
jgi:hypothetical protein